MLKKINITLPPFFKLSGKIYVLFIALFSFWRLIFYLIDKNESTLNVSYGIVFYGFFMGARFDTIIICYLLLSVVLLFIFKLFVFKNSQKINSIIKWHLYISGALILFISSADTPYFKQFGSHISKNAMAWTATPDYIIKLIFSDFSYWGFLLVYIAVLFVYVYSIRSFISGFIKESTASKHSAKSNVIFILSTIIILIVGCRGRLASKSPMNEGMSIICDNAFVNQVALNPNFTLIKSLSRKNKSIDYSKTINSDLLVAQRFYSNNQIKLNPESTEEIIGKANLDSINKLNVIVVLMESLSIGKLGYYNNPNLSPKLTELINSSVYFDRFFSSGIHTFNGLFSSSSGYPSVYTEQGLRQYTKKPFITLANLLQRADYQTLFCTTHDPVFDNMEGFFKMNGFKELISENDFKSSESIGVTGIPDHLLYNKLIEKINANNNKPFVAYVMTGTDHGPWRIPENIPFKPTGKDDKEKASQYADWAIGQLITESKKQKWYENTVFVILGDHGQIMNDVYDMPITYHHIPLIIHCPKYLKPAINHNLGYQPDLISTLCGKELLNIQFSNNTFGSDIFKENRPFIFFSADDKIGYVTNNDYFFFHDLKTNMKKLVKYKAMDNTNYYTQQKSFADSTYNKTMSIYNTAHYLLQNTYFNF